MGPEGASDSRLMTRSEQPGIGFVACIEGGVLEAQTLLLFESIRRHAGRFKDCALYALSICFRIDGSSSAERGFSSGCCLTCISTPSYVAAMTCALSNINNSR